MRVFNYSICRHAVGIIYMGILIEFTHAYPMAATAYMYNIIICFAVDTIFELKIQFWCTQVFFHVDTNV
jgi:hypothetical protein